MVDLITEPPQDNRTAEELAEEEIRSQIDAEEVLIRDVGDTIGNYKEVILRSKSLNKQVRTGYIYKKIIKAKKIVGRQLQGANKEIEPYGTVKESILKVV